MSSAQLDLAALEEIYGDDREGIVELVDMVVGQAAGASVPLHRAVEARDAVALREAAHGLKGAAANVGAVAVCEAARTLELRARDVAWTDIDDLLCELDSALARARAELGIYRTATA